MSQKPISFKYRAHFSGKKGFLQLTTQIREIVLIVFTVCPVFIMFGLTVTVKATASCNLLSLFMDKQVSHSLM